MINFIDIMKYEEGISETAYLDSLKCPTIGIGKRIGNIGDLLSYYNFTLPVKVAEYWLEYDLEKLRKSLENHNLLKVVWNNCNEARQDILVSMAYQLGIEGLLGFHKMLAEIENEDFDKAAEEMKLSRWHEETKQRCEREAEVMRVGNFNIYQSIIC